MIISRMEGYTFKAINNGNKDRSGYRHIVMSTSIVRYRCKVCGYIYDPKMGDPEAGIKPGTAFSNLPPDWICPVCGAPQSEFEQLPD